MTQPIGIAMADGISKVLLGTPPTKHPQTSNWAPLIKLVGERHASDFMLMNSTGDIIHYKHVNTRRYLNIHRVTGETYKHTAGEVPSGYEPIPTDQALAHVFA